MVRPALITAGVELPFLEGKPDLTSAEGLREWIGRSLGLLEDCDRGGGEGGSRRISNFGTSLGWVGGLEERVVMATSAIAVPLGLLFLISGFLINGIQVITLVLLLFSRKAYRIANFVLMDLLWSELIWLCEWWAGIKVKVYTDPETLRLLGKEHALLICNHRSDIDWLVGWLLAKVC
jgi:hypothetical protein